MRLLVVDDEAIVGRALQRCLSADHDVEVLSDGVEAVARIRRGDRFDAILCDVVMPHLTGQEVYEAIATIDREQARRILFMSGRVSDVGCRVGRIPCVAKPFDLPLLRMMIDGFLPIRLADGASAFPSHNRRAR